MKIKVMTTQAFEITTAISECEGPEVRGELGPQCARFFDETIFLQGWSKWSRETIRGPKITKIRCSCAAGRKLLWV
jgi:hypothetical protein